MKTDDYLIASIWGMNFGLMPELNHPYANYYALARSTPFFPS